MTRALIHPSAWRDRPKSLGSTPGVALQTTVKALLDPFRPPHNVRIRFRSLPRTPFRTVSEVEFSEVRLCASGPRFLTTEAGGPLLYPPTTKNEPTSF